MSTHKERKRILLHCCCGPCAIYPLKILKEEGYEVTGLFYNPNIHPFREFERRVLALEEVMDAMETPWLFHDAGYGLKEWIDYTGESGFKRPQRCRLCYQMRIQETARLAQALEMDLFSTTLLYSIYQDHEAIRSLCQEAGQGHGVVFLYRDFREGWKEGKEEAHRIGIYTQPYCGCIFSEEERYEKRKARLQKRFSATFTQGGKDNGSPF